MAGNRHVAEEPRSSGVNTGRVQIAGTAKPQYFTQFDTGGAIIRPAK